MTKIYSPNKGYTGRSASVSFCNGIGETDSPRLVEWFKKHGYKVEKAEECEESSEIPVDEDTVRDQEPPKKDILTKRKSTKKAGE